MSSVQLKYVAEIIAGQSPASGDVSELRDGLPFLQGNADFGPAYPSARLECSLAPKTAKAGDSLLSVRAPVGALNTADKDYGIGRGLNAIRGRLIDARYLFWLLRDAKPYLDSVSTGSTFAAVSAANVGSIPVPVTSNSEQARIADYLDAQIAKIDLLIEKQERLIETLAERQRAVISNAVTRGLDPGVLMKHPGVGAIGDIPHHWDVVSLRYLIKKVESGTSVNALDVAPDAGEVGVLKTSCVYSGEFDSRQSKSVNAEELARVTCPVKANRLIVSRMNTPALVGAVGLTTKDEPSTYLPDRLWQVELSGVEPGFVHAWTKTPAYRDQVSEVCVGTSSSMQNLSQDDFKGFQLAIPPTSEQQRVIAYVGKVKAQTNALSSKAREMIEVLKERRQALISAAVTGKIDVRGLA